MPCQVHALSHRARLPGGAAPFTLFYLSALLHNPVSVACSCFVGVSDAARAFWRMLDVILIFTCAGAARMVLMYNCPAWRRGVHAAGDDERHARLSLCHSFA